MLSEFREAAAVTKRVLGRVPADKLSWKPHPKSMSLGQLAIHIATVPGALERITQQEAFDVSQGNFVPQQPSGMEEIHSASSRAFARWKRSLPLLRRRIATICGCLLSMSRPRPLRRLGFEADDEFQTHYCPVGRLACVGAAAFREVLFAHDLDVRFARQCA